jgi:YVTN family beta-propeller protein
LRIRTLCAGALAPVMAGLGVALTAPAATAAATGAVTTAALPLTGFTSIVADTAHREEFISGGYHDTSIAVTDAAGNVVTTIPLGTRATSLALSPDRRSLYAALPDADTVSVIDTATLKATARYSTGKGTAPQYVAAVGRSIWFGYGQGIEQGIGVIDQHHGTVTLMSERDFDGAPMLVSSPAAPGVLIAGNAHMDPSVIEEFNVTTGSPVGSAGVSGPGSAEVK